MKKNSQANMNKAIEIIERCLPLNKLKFKESSRFFNNKIFPTVIYDSDTCRIRFFDDGKDRYGDHHIFVHYGRLEVPDDAIVLVGKDAENFHLYWHSVRIPLWFLDGKSPLEAVNEKDPRFMKEYKQSELAKRFETPERSLGMHAAIWETYGRQFFDIFDTNKSNFKWY